MRLGLGVLLCLIPAVPAVAHAAAPVIAVFGIEDGSKKLKANDLSQLTAYLSGQVASGGAFKVVPQDDLRAALTGKKADSYKACFDTACQIEIGKELAAEKTLHTRIVAIGSQCALTATVYDLRTSASDAAATEKAKCDVDSLVGALDRVVASLSKSTAVPSTSPAKSADTGEVLVELFADGTSPLAATSKGQFGAMTCTSTPKVIECKTTIAQEGYFDMSPALANTVDNFVVEATIRVLDKTQNGNYALSIGKKNAEGKFGYKMMSFGFDVRNSPATAFINYCDGNGWTMMLDHKPEEVIGAAAPIKIRAEVQGRRVRVFYNEKKISVFDSPIPLDGNIALSVGGFGGARIERLVVRDLPKL